MKKRGITGIPVVYSKEKALTPMWEESYEERESGLVKAKRQTPGSVSFVPSAAGLILAGKVIQDLFRGKTR